MKGKELIKLIQDRGLEEFDIKFSILEGYDIFPNIRSFDVSGVSDIGYSDKVLILEGEENK